MIIDFFWRSKKIIQNHYFLIKSSQIAWFFSLQILNALVCQLEILEMQIISTKIAKKQENKGENNIRNLIFQLETSNSLS